MACRTKQFQVLTDIDLAWDLMTDVYSTDGRNGPAAPFFEYAVNSSWLDKRYLPLNRFWLDGDKTAAFVFYENPVNSIHFVLRPGYEPLANEMIAYAESAFSPFADPLELVLAKGQAALIRAAQKRGYRVAEEEIENIFDFRTGKLDYPLPEGFHFMDPLNADPLKAAKCMWDAFNSDTLGPFVHWEKPVNDSGWTPHDLYYSVLGSTISPPPHATYEYTVSIANAQGECVCFSGMWWVEKNHLAYMEPLCTAPGYQRRGLAAAALSEHDRRLRPRGALTMTGGGNAFYRKIGYRGEITLLHLKKDT
ncbi:MAG: GNAT family N-acetyltransferase [Clostridia bacterium]|nr:GNAT family N-acetyltransferase [Clostridia bacterium]